MSMSAYNMLYAYSNAANNSNGASKRNGLSNKCFENQPNTMKIDDTYPQPPGPEAGARAPMGGLWICMFLLI